ncbi:neuroblast differentiation-associated protein AHNAK-like [Cololabis saira]|uniref:neuroblast differentiation-associated protein AHNAK-like n=1 Tax=Cololabis saira TaxID=129043 RepID=UPI002AD55D95|nr:neuroblast differentiation-associated protein AHNAK-like [Cololabis saira]
MCDCFHLAFPNWHAASSGTGRRLRGPETPSEDSSVCEEPGQFTEGERPRPQGSSPVEEYPEYKEREAEHDPHHKGGSGLKSKRSGLGSMFERRSTPKMSKLKEVHSPEAGVIVKTPKDGCSEGLVYGGGGKDGIFIKEVMPESPASKSLKVKEGDQLLSATVYFDDVSYEDAIQILEHAQAYKMKLCLKRKADVAETEAATASDAIPEEDIESAEMREEGKTKRRGDNRISWPKFPSFGKGRKSRFIRSHSSSEADEQRTLELSPTTSDTDSPIKSQNALKGKKKNKKKLPSLTKRGRISSSEDQDTEAPISVEISSDAQQKQDSAVVSPASPEGPSGESQGVAEDTKAGEDLRPEQDNQTKTDAQSVQHKVEITGIDGAVKTEDLTVAPADLGSPSGTKTLDKKKKKKEKSELKPKLWGREKSPKKDTKAKSSPKRLKTLGASIETEDLPETEKSGLKLGDQPGLDTKNQVANESMTTEIQLPKVELVVEDAAIVQKSPKKQKQVTKAGPTTTLMGDVTVEPTTEGAQIFSEALAKGSVPPAQLPKREDIEIPGMEDSSSTSTVQMSLDMESVKEAVSKLPGFKLPQVDTSGMPIPEEITVIDANAQRISVKTPTKVAENKSKNESPLTRIYMSTSPEISMTTVKLPKLTSDDLMAEEPVIELQKPQIELEFKPQEKDIITPQDLSTLQGQDIDQTGAINLAVAKEAHKKSKLPKITMPSFGIDIPKPKTSPKDLQFEAVKRKDSKQTVGITGDMKISETFITEYTDALDEFADKKDGHITVSDVIIEADEGLGAFPSDVSGDAVSGDDNLKIDGAQIKTPEREGKGSRFKMPVLNISVPKVKGAKMDLSPSKKDATDATAKAKAEVQIPEAPETYAGLGTASDYGTEQKELEEEAKHGLKIQTLEAQTEYDAQESKFKIPKLGLKMPRMKGSEFDVSLSRTGGDAKTKVQLPEAQDTDVSLGAVRVSIPEQKMDANKLDKEGKPLGFHGDLDRRGGKLKMQTFGIKMPKIKGSEFDMNMSKEKAEMQLSEAQKTDVSPGKVDVSIAEQKLEVEIPQMEIKSLPAEGELEAQGGKFRRPKFGIKMPKMKGPEFDMKFPGVPEADVGLDVSMPEQKMGFEKPQLDIKTLQPGSEQPAPSTDVEDPSIDAKPAKADYEMKGSKFKMPNLGFSMPKVKGPKLDIKLPDVEAPEIEVSPDYTDPSSSTFETANISFSTSETKAEVEIPEVSKTDISLGKPSIFRPKGKVGFGKPDVQIKPPLARVKVEGQGSKLKMETTGISLPNVQDVETPEIDLNFGTIDASAAEVNKEIEKTDVEIATQTGMRSPSKFKMPVFKFPKFGVTTPSVSAEVPDAEIDINIEKSDLQVEKPHKDIDVPEFTAEVDVPEVQVPSLDIPMAEQQPDVEAEAKQKKTRFMMPKFSFSKPSVKASEVDVSFQDKSVEFSEGTVEVKGQSVTMKSPEIPMPETDLSLSMKDDAVTLPEAELTLGDVQLKRPSVEASEINLVAKDTERSPLKFKMPSFKLPKFGAGTPSSSLEQPAVDKDVTIDGAEVNIPEGVLTVSIEPPAAGPPEALVTITETEHEAKPSKFKLPNFGWSEPQIDVDISLPEAEAEARLTSDEMKQTAEVEIKAPEIKVGRKDSEASVSKFKMPSFKLPKFGVSTPSSTVEVPALEDDVKTGGVEISEPVVAVSIDAPSVECEAPSIDIKSSGAEHEGKGIKFKLPKLSFSAPQTEGPDVDLSLSKPDADVTLPEAEAEVKVMDVSKEASAEVEIKAPEMKVGGKDVDGSPSKFKMPSFKLPKFGLAKSATVEVPTVDTQVETGGVETQISEEVLAVSIDAPNVECEGPSIDLKTTGTEQERKGIKFKLPSLGFSVAQTEGPGVDLSLSKPGVDVTLPEAEAGLKLTDDEIKTTSIDVEIKAPEVKVGTKDKEASASKFKMPSFKLPKFGVSTPSSTVEVPALENDVKTAGVEISEPVVAVSIDAPSVECEAPSIDIKSTGTEIEGKGRKFKLPSLGFSVPQGKGPDVDLSLSKPDVDVSLPEAEAELKPSEDEMKTPSIDAEIKAPEVNIGRKDAEGSASKFKMPSFKLPKFGLGTSATVEVPTVDTQVETGGVETQISEPVLAVSIDAPNVECEGPSIDLKTTGTEQERKGIKFKLPSLGFSVAQTEGPGVDLSLSKPDADVTLPEAEAELKLSDNEMKTTAIDVEIKAPEVKVASASKFKMPSFKLPKFGTPSSTVEVPALEDDVKTGGVEISEPVLAVSIDPPSVECEAPSIDIKSTGTEIEGKGRKFKLPSLGFSVPQGKGPDVDLSLSKPDVDVTLPEAEAEVKVTDVEVEKVSAEVETPVPDVKAVTKDTEVSPSKFKLPTFKLPKFGLSTQSSTAEIPAVEAESQVSEQVLAVSIDASSIESSSIDMKTSGTEHEGKGIKFKLPSLGFSVSQTKGPDADLDLPKTDIDVPEVKADVVPGIDIQRSSVEGSSSTLSSDLKINESMGSVSVSDGGSMEADVKVKKTSWFSFSKTSTKAPETDISLDVDVAAPEAKVDAKVEVNPPDSNIQESSSVSTDGEPAADLDAKLKKPRFSLPRFSFSSKQLPVEIKPPECEESDISKKAADITVPVDVKAPEIKDQAVSVEAEAGEPKKDGEVMFTGATIEGKLPTAEMKEDGGAVSEADVPTIEVEAKLKRPSWAFPRMSFSRTVVKSPDTDGNAETSKADVAPLETQAEVPPPDADAKAAPVEDAKGAPVEDAKAAPVEESPVAELDPSLKKTRFSLPRFSFSKASPKEPEVKTEVPHVEVSVTDVGVNAKPHEAEPEPAEPEAGDDVQEDLKDVTPNTETDAPSKFKLFKMPKLSISRQKPEEVPADNDSKEPDPAPEADAKGDNLTLTSFVDILKTIDVELDVAQTDKDGLNLETSKELGEKEQPKSKQDTVKSPEKASWFKFPKFGLSSPSEPPKSPEPVDEELSPTSSVQSSDAFADVSSSSPTKVTVKYSDPSAAADVVTSTTRTKLIANIPNLPEKITILSSGVSSSSEDTLRLEVSEPISGQTASSLKQLKDSKHSEKMRFFK